MKVIALNVVLGAALLLAPWLISRLVQDGAHIPEFFRIGGWKRANAINKVSRAATTEDMWSTCDDFASCPQGWSLVASPSLVLCGKVCKQETCCLDDGAIQVLHEREAPRRLTGGNQTDNTTSTTITTTTYTDTATTATVTTTMASNVATVLTGSIGVTVDDPQAFVNDPKVKEAWENTIASKTSVPSSWVECSLAVGRRLSDDSSTHLRRLSGTVTISYSITLPATMPTSGLGSSVSADSITTYLSSADPAAFQTELASQLSTLGATSYSVTVNSISTPTVSYVTITTTTTNLGPENQEAAAFTKVAFSPAHAMALLVMAISALSS